MILSSKSSGSSASFGCSNLKTYRGIELVSNELLTCVLLMPGVLGGLLVSRVPGKLTSRVSDGLPMVLDVQLHVTSDELLMMSVVLLIPGVLPMPVGCTSAGATQWVPVELVGLLSYVEKRMSIRQYYLQKAGRGCIPASPVGVGLVPCARGRRCRQ